MFKTIKKLEDRIKALEESREYYKKECEILRTDVQQFHKKLDEKNLELAEFNHIKKENEIMKKYYKLDEELSSEVQAKVIADLRLHDMEYKQLVEKIKECNIRMDRIRMDQMISNSMTYYFRKEIVN